MIKAGYRESVLFGDILITWTVRINNEEEALEVFIKKKKHGNAARKKQLVMSLKTNCPTTREVWEKSVGFRICKLSIVDRIIDRPTALFKAAENSTN